MTRTDRIKNTLDESLKPLFIDVEDESTKHKGHPGASPAGETHFRVTVVANQFVDMPLIARHRMIHSLLQSEFTQGLHALSLKVYAPLEWKEQGSRSL